MESRRVLFRSDDHRVDHPGDVVDSREAGDLHFASIRSDLDLADVTAAGEGKVERVVESVLVEPRLELLDRVVVRHIGCQRHLREGQRLVGSGDGELAVLEQIGRASCRERVCKYGEISEVAESLKKKNRMNTKK